MCGARRGRDVRGTRDGTGLGRLRGADRRGAIVASLIVVGVAATAGALLNWHRGTLGVGVAARFGGLGAVGAMAVFAALAVVGTLVGARTASRARPDVLRRAFGLLVFGVGVYTGAVAFV